MAKSQTLRLTWRNQAGRIYAMTINNPVDNLTQQQVANFMDLVINKNVILSTGGPLVAKVDAILTDQETQDLYEPA